MEAWAWALVVQIVLVFEQGVEFDGLWFVSGSFSQVEARVLATWQVVEAFPGNLGVGVQGRRGRVLRARLDVSAVA